MVRKDNVWRLVFADATKDQYGDTRGLRYALNGKVYECKNCNCFRRISNSISNVTKEQFELYIRYVIDQNYAEVNRIAWRKQLEKKLVENTLTNVEQRNLIEFRRSDEIAEDEMTQDISGTKGLTYFKCLLQ